MKLLTALVFVTPLLALQQVPFRLEPGEFRWIPVNVKQLPTEIDCKFEVVSGGPTAHLELLRMHDFRLFTRNQPHRTVAVSPSSKSGDFRRTVENRGSYAVVMVNDKNAGPVMVTLEVRTEIDPDPGLMSRELPPRRRLVVILISFALFFITVTWSGLRLLRASREPEHSGHG